MRAILGVLVVGLLVGCGGAEEAQVEQNEAAVPTPTEVPEGTVEAMWPPPPPPYCAEHMGLACPNVGARMDCIWTWTEPGMCYCDGSSWQCS
jgi:hypothetical protein